MSVWIRELSRISIPASVDALRTVNDRELVRGIYFVVSSEVPWPDWVPKLFPDQSGDNSEALSDNGPRLHLLGSAGVVYGPASHGRRFTDPKQLDQIFDIFDRPAEGLSVEFRDIMIPARWILEPCRPQDVLRVPLEQFHRAYRYTAGLLTMTDLLGNNPDDDFNSVLNDSEEGAVFRQWAGNQIAEAKRQYAQKEPGLKLASRELPEGWQADA